MEVTEEDLQKLKNKIWAGHKKNPKAMFAAFCLIFVDVVIGEFKEFTNGLEELNEEDRLAILKGMVEKRSRFWDNPDLDEAYGMAERILKEYDNQTGKRRKQDGSKSKYNR